MFSVFQHILHIGLTGGGMSRYRRPDLSQQTGANIIAKVKSYIDALTTEQLCEIPKQIHLKCRPPWRHEKYSAKGAY
jgi:hypothetical protein